MEKSDLISDLLMLKWRLYDCVRGPAVATHTGDITQLLQRWRNGDQEAEGKLFEQLQPELRKIAACCFRGERPGHTLQPTALVNEAFLRLVRSKNVNWQDRSHFLAVAARVMRHYLVDHARSRPNIQLVPLEEIHEPALHNGADLALALATDAQLRELRKISPQREVIVELKFFLGLTDEEAAKTLNLSLRTF